MHGRCHHNCRQSKQHMGEMSWEGIINIYIYNLECFIEAWPWEPGEDFDYPNEQVLFEEVVLT